MALEDFAWTDAPEPRQHGARWLGWTTFWLVVVGGAVALGWALASALVTYQN